MKSKIRNLVLALIYALSFHWVYVVWMEPLFSYIGVQYKGITTGRIVLTYIIALVPILWLDDNIKRPSQFVYWVTYLLTYVPMIFVPLFYGFDIFDFYAYNLTYLLGFFLMGTSYYFKLYKFNFFKLEDRLFWSIFLSIVFIFAALIVYYFGSTLQIVNILDSKEVYGQRLREDVDRGFLGYPINFLAGVFAPFLFAYGLCYRKKRMVLLSLIVQVLIFSIGANKAYILITIMMLAVYVIFRTSFQNVGKKIILGLSIPMVVIGVVYQFASASVSQAFFALSSLIIFRTIGISTYIMPFYVDFFKDHPLTYYTHINIINKLSGFYPYDVSLGRVLGKAYFNNDHYNMNANFWLTDGIASVGMIGIPIISLIGALVFYILDCSAIGHKKVFVIMLISYAATIIQNVSLFTTLITGGLGMTIFLLIIKSQDKADLLKQA